MNAYFGELQTKGPSDATKAELSELGEGWAEHYYRFSAGKLTIKYFRYTGELDKYDISPLDAFRIYACACRSGDCAGKWPIAEIDAELYGVAAGRPEDWPYVCVRVSNEKGKLSISVI